ncbi:MAG TPA: molybdopterin-dependent oxidoreductase [Kofleriaceae bacterium]|nr:molybdopterin-dependent oxidoreductase [Kofleriaceae bacterium]
MTDPDDQDDEPGDLLRRDRRNLLAGLGALGAGALVAGCRPRWTPPEDDHSGIARAKPYVPGAEAFATGEERWAMTSCAQCPAGCGLRVRVIEGRAVRIEGSADNPINQGGVGARGLASLQVLYDPDRLRQPLIRRGTTLEPATWDQALGLVAKQLGELRAGGRARDLVTMSGRPRGMMNDLLARFATAFGAPRPTDGRMGHGLPLARAMRASLGVDEVPAFDWTRAGYVLSLEAGLFEDSCQTVFLSRVAASMRRGGGERPAIVHVGSRFDLTAYNADQFIRVRPGTSGAFALGVCRELLTSFAEDAGRARQHSEGFEGFAALAEGYPPERVAEITGAPAGLIAKVARRMIDRPSFAVADERSVGFTNGVDTGRVVIALNALLGSVESARGGLRAPTVAPVGDWPAPVLDQTARAESVAGAQSYAQILERLDRAQAALLYHANPLYARAEPARWRQALAKIPLVVSFSPFLDETVAEAAHVVLPDDTFLERYEDATPAPAIPRAVMGVRQPVVTRLHDTRATGDVIIDLAHRLGGTVAASFPWGSFREAMEARLLGLHDAHRGTVRGASPRGFLSALYAAGSWAEVADAPTRSVRHVFPSAWQEPRWQGEPSRYPLRLVIYRPLGSAEGGGANQPWLHTLRPYEGARPWRPQAAIHPTAAPSGVGEGDRVVIESEVGEIEMAVHLDPRLEPGTIAVPTGGGHTAFGRTARRSGGANPMVLVGSDPRDEGDAVCRMRVSVRKAGSRA